MNFSWFIAGTFFFRKQRGTRFLSFILLMSVAGVALGAGGLLISLSIAHGFKSAIYEKIYSFSPDIEVRTYLPEQLDRADTLRTFLLAQDGVRFAEPVVTGRMMVQAGRDVDGVLVRGISSGPLGGGRLTDDVMEEGLFTFEVNQSGLKGVVIGSGVAASVNARIGERLTLFSFPAQQGGIQTPEIAQFYVSGIFHTGIERFDDEFIFAEIGTVRKLLGKGNTAATHVEVQVVDRAQLMHVFESIRDDTDYPYVTETVYMRHRNMFAWVELQEATVPLIIGVMILIAAFNVIGTLLMMVLERVRDIGMLKAMGASNRAIERIFLLEGFFIATAGLLIGTGLSLLFYWLQTEFGIIPLPEENYYMSTAPVEPHFLDFVLVFSVTMILCLLASWLPARYASNIQPVKTIARI